MKDETKPQAPDERPSTGSLFSQIIAQIGALLRREIDLTRAEIGETVNIAMIGFGLIVAGMVLAVTALNVLAGALLGALVTMGLDPVWAAVIEGGVLGLIALGLVLKGSRQVKSCSLAPKRFAKNVRKDAEVLKEKFK